MHFEANFQFFPLTNFDSPHSAARANPKRVVEKRTISSSNWWVLSPWGKTRANLTYMPWKARNEGVRSSAPATDLFLFHCITCWCRSYILQLPWDISAKLTCRQRKCCLSQEPTGSLSYFASPDTFHGSLLQLLVHASFLGIRGWVWWFPAPCLDSSGPSGTLSYFG